MTAVALSTRLLCLCTLLFRAAATHPQVLLNQLAQDNLEGKQSGPKTYKLRLCNAFAWSAPLEMRRVQEPQLVEYPLPYKECHDYNLPLSDGDELQFRAGDLNIGTFYVKGLPKTPAMLLLVPHRKRADSMAVSFDSHMYTEGTFPQVAIVDAGAGMKPAQLYLHEREHKEALRFSSVVTLTPGNYEVDLASNSTTGRALRTQLTALAQEKYVVVRMGNAANSSDQAYPEDMVVFPKTKSGAACRSFGLLLLAMFWNVAR